jgi:hypothetical protein
MKLREAIGMDTRNPARGYLSACLARLRRIRLPGAAPAEAASDPGPAASGMPAADPAELLEIERVASRIPSWAPPLPVPLAESKD